MQFFKTFSIIFVHTYIIKICTVKLFVTELQEGVRLSLEGAQASFISYDRLVISLKGGELYVLTLYADSMRSVRSFHFEKAAASVLTTCTCLCEENYLFLGSRLGNSLLLRFIEKEQSTVLNLEEKSPAPKLQEAQPPTKKKRLDTLGKNLINVDRKSDKLNYSFLKVFI